MRKRRYDLTPYVLLTRLRLGPTRYVASKNLTHLHWIPKNRQTAMRLLWIRRLCNATTHLVQCHVGPRSNDSRQPFRMLLQTGRAPSALRTPRLTPALQPPYCRGAAGTTQCCGILRALLSVNHWTEGQHTHDESVWLMRSMTKRRSKFTPSSSGFRANPACAVNS